VLRRPSALFFFHRHRDSAIRRKTNLLALDLGNQAEVDEMMVSLMLALAAIGLGQLDLAVFNRSTVPTCTPSEPITSMCSLMLFI
jgi:hypothetical protein